MTAAASASRAKRETTRADEASPEEPSAAQQRYGRALQRLRARARAIGAGIREKLRTSAVGAFDRGITLLQRLRQRVSGKDAGDDGRGGVRAGAAKRALPGRGKVQDSAGEPMPIKRPRRRLRGLLVHLAVLLIGGMTGMALSYDLLERLLDRRAAELIKQGAKLSKHAKSAARLQAQLAAAQERQAKAEARLAAARAESERKLGELEGRRADAEARLAASQSARASAMPRVAEAVGSRAKTASVRAAWSRTGNCTLSGGNVDSALKGCIAKMGR